MSTEVNKALETLSGKGACTLCKNFGTSACPNSKLLTQKELDATEILREQGIANAGCENTPAGEKTEAFSATATLTLDLEGGQS